MLERYRIDVSKAKNSMDRIITFGNFRFSVIKEKIIRIEFSTRKKYTDEPTQVVWKRELGNDAYSVLREKESIVVKTQFLEICCKNAGAEINDFVVCYNIPQKKYWSYGEKIDTLKGTIRTLDGINGSVKLNEGMLARDGFVVLEDSNSFCINEVGELYSRQNGEDYHDLYVFFYQNEYQACIRDFLQLTGGIPLLPKYALGNWWSRFHRYDEKEYLELMDTFREKKIPVSVAVIDMDWHLTEIDPKYGSGWTGYTWNRELFPSPRKFLGKLHEKGLKVALNIHPADGIRGYEECYPKMVNKLSTHKKIDAQKEEPILFDATDYEFLEAYFECAHEPHEKSGVDFWWIDWQQGEESKLPGLDPLWVLNHYHYLDSMKNNQRGLILSRYAEYGSQRYPVGFSGDTIISWDSLRFQPYFTATASNVGYGWWSHDIGGHMLGSYDEELQIRWIQYGIFSPINRMHSSSSRFNHKEPWNYTDKTNEIITKYLQLRYKMLPYLYTMNYRMATLGEMLIRPMYYLHPIESEAYQVPNQYYFGTEMICVPVTSPIDFTTRLAAADCWLPEGIYVDWMTGISYAGGRRFTLYRDIEKMSIMLKAGAIIVCDGREGTNQLDNPDVLEITIVAGKNGEFQLYEDDGSSMDYQDNKFVTTLFELDFDKDQFIIHPSEGELSLIPKKRKYELHFLGFRQVEQVKCCINDEVCDVSFDYDQKKHELFCRIEAQVDEKVSIHFIDKMKLAENDMPQLWFEILDKAYLPYVEKEEIYKKICDGEIALIDDSHIIKGPLLEIYEAQNGKDSCDE